MNTIVSTPSAAHPKALVRKLNLADGVITFDWLDADEAPVDSGNSIAPITLDGTWPTEAEVIAAITAVGT